MKLRLLRGQEDLRILLALQSDSEPWFLLEHAVDWAQKFGNRLDLCTVLKGVGDPTGVSEYSEVSVLRMRARYRVATRGLERLMRDVPSHLRGMISVLEGDPSQALLERAREYRLVVVGRKTNRGAISFLRGEISGQLARKCPIPLMIVGGRRPRSGRLSVLAIATNAHEYDAANWVVEHIPESALVTVRIWSTNGLAGRAIAVHAESGDADLVAVPACNRAGVFRWLFGSVAEGLLRESRRSVLVVPTRDGGDLDRPGPRRKQA